MRLKNKLKIFIFTFVIILLPSILQINLISASINFGNLSHEIESTYTPSQPIRGWINVSFNKEPTTTLISAFNKNLTIKDFLDNNRLDCSLENECSCLPTDCQTSYSTIGSKANDKNYTLNPISTKLFGIRITDNISQVTDFRFNVSTNAQSSCLNPLMFDLLDNGIDWQMQGVSNETCFIKAPSGCYNSSYQILQGGNVQIGVDHLCQKIKVPSAGGFKIGAKINGTGASTFTLSIETGGVGKTCTVFTNPGYEGSTETSCNVVLKGLQGETEADICIFSDRQTNYKIKFEDHEACGYVLQANGEKFAHDFDIFAFPLKYSPQSKFTFSNKLFDDENNITKLLFDYIDRKYYKECNPECIIPVRIYSGTPQSLKISELSLDYGVRGLGIKETGFYDIKESPALISSEFLKLNLEKANLSTPNTPGNINLILNIGNKTLVKNISIINIPKIVNILPTETSLLVPTTFASILDFSGNKTKLNLTYNWNFGDNTPIVTTTKDRIEHVYTKAGVYQLTLNISNEKGETSKMVSINVIATYTAINNTIKEYKKRLENVNNDLFNIPDWIKNTIEQVEGIENLESEVNRLERDFKESFQEDFSKLMIDLTNLKIPYKIDASLLVKPTNFVQSEDKLDISVLEQEFDAGKVEAEKEEYYNAINNWLAENLDVSFESKTYSSYYYDGGEKVLLSHLKLVLTPKKDIEEFYVIIDGDKSKIKFKEDYSEKELSNGYGIRFSSLTAGQVKEIEFSYPELVEPLNIPVYVSPEFKELNLEPVAGVCNNNNICEKDLGENYKNCRVDCKPLTLTIIFLVILFFIASVIYIVLQEWYKRYYENYLFKDRNQLFNLITFMHNSLNQKLSRSQIFDKLKPLGWNSEQLTYAWNKLHGKRTGMWEIPIFMPFEKAQLKKEIEKRQDQTARPSYSRSF